MLYATYAGKFDSMFDKDNRICQVAARAIHRDGFRTDDYMGKQFILSERQKKQYVKYCDEAVIDKTACDVNVFNVVDRVKEDQEDVLFGANDAVKHFTLNLYGTIENLFEINGIQWADCSFWSEHDTEILSNIDFVNLNAKKDYIMVPLNELTPPLVFGIDELKIWFIGHIPKTLPWVDEHLRDL